MKAKVIELKYEGKTIAVAKLTEMDIMDFVTKKKWADLELAKLKERYDAKTERIKNLEGKVSELENKIALLLGEKE